MDKIARLCPAACAPFQMSRLNSIILIFSVCFSPCTLRRSDHRWTDR
jgi:hypothetical protein